MVTKSAYLADVRASVGKSYDTDGMYNAQCVDLITHFQRKYWNYRAWGNAIDFVRNGMPANWKRGTVAQMGVQPGDTLVWKWGSTDIYGHIGICVEYANGQATSVEQNVDGTFGGPARYRTRGLGQCVAVLRPNFEPETGKATTVAPVARKEYAESGTFTVTVRSINVRRSPDTKSDPVAVYYQGQSIKYDRVIVDVDGYVWISYIGASSGKRNYIATGATRNGVRYGPAWGTFK
ncbi:CHAP domain-containing protein [Streptococcus suis]|nr:CHAP domain-containing protein [Streptococcus suis]